ncbi:unnamed protein product [Rotaria magnacalcarata]|uniref:Uncharacterized protein n=1 Tax=Rotaria magnacalcarata TaxID=392030 RepID=A0A816R958_9BILA|nr:unnamed protein product [Rotaria magnacalcarata]
MPDTDNQIILTIENSAVTSDDWCHSTSLTTTSQNHHHIQSYIFDGDDDQDDFDTYTDRGLGTSGRPLSPEASTSHSRRFSKIGSRKTNTGYKTKPGLQYRLAKHKQTNMNVSIDQQQSISSSPSMPLIVAALSGSVPTVGVQCDFCVGSEQENKTT